MHLISSMNAQFLNDTTMNTLLPLWVAINFAILSLPSTEGLTKHFTFNVNEQNITRLCHTRSVITVNGKYPGPPLVVRDGDRVIVKVVNNVSSNITIHWHGVKQLTSGWADGPAYVTQCPIQTGNAYTYNFTITGQRGTLWWHAHVSWLRSSVHGPIVIYPRKNDSYPFLKPFKEFPIIFGEWFNTDPEAIIKEALETGAGPNVSDAYTINGLPGPLYNCSSKDTYKVSVEAGKTYLLRLINAVLNEELFFSIANHSLTVVETDASYVKPFRTSTVLIAPGQTMNVILETKATITNATFYMLARPYTTGAAGTFDNTTAAGILSYSSQPLNTLANFRPILPPVNATSFVANFTAQQRSLATVKFPANVPLTVDKNLFFTVGLGTTQCPNNATCQGPNGTKFAASVSNISFALPKVSLLESYYNKKSKGEWYLPKFPERPLNPFNYTGTPPNNTMVTNATKLMVLPYNTSVELVMQGTSILGVESHPLHIHGYNFYVVGRGFGNYDPQKDPLSYNLVDPVERNTVDVPAGGWVAIRFVADNPGVWFMHCHLDVHLSWGLRMAWLVLDGPDPGQKLQQPPPDLPRC